MSKESEKLQLTIAKVDGPVFDGLVDSVTVPGSDGVMSILAKHQSMISTLSEGQITIKIDGKEDEIYEVEKGMVEISDNSATILI